MCDTILHNHKTPLVSVAMLAYNHMPYIRQAIDGVLSQKAEFPIELVIGEDCSTDGTREVVFEYGRKFPDTVRVVTSEKNVGMHLNAQRMLHACRGKYVAFCEGDDYFHSTQKLQKQVDCFHNEPDCVMVHSNYDLFYVKTKHRIKDALFYRKDWNDSNAYDEILTGKRYVHTLTVLIKRSILNSVIRDNPECTDKKYLLGDLQMWLEISRLGKVICLPESLATHNMLPESATHSNNPYRELNFALSVKELIYHYIEKYPCSTEVEQTAKSSACLFVLGKSWKANDSSLGKDIYDELCRIRPRFSPHAFLLYFGGRSAINRIISIPLIHAYLFARRTILEKIYHRLQTRKTRLQ